jgi:hypothetical protein
MEIIFKKKLGQLILKTCPKNHNLMFITIHGEVH